MAKRSSKTSKTSSTVVGRPVATIPGPRPAPPAPAGIVPPPQGMYDPSLDAALGQVQRGYGDTMSDFTRDYGATGQGGRAFNDYQLGVNDLTQQVAYGRQDLATQRDRGTQDYQQQQADIRQGYSRQISDLLNARSRGTEDFHTALANIGRQYQQLGQQQTQGASAAGLGGGGALRQAVAKRQANQTLTEQPVRTNFDRFTQDSGTQEQRLGQDQTTALDRSTQGYQRQMVDIFTQGARSYGVDPNQIGGAAGQQMANMGLVYGRQVSDANTALQRAQRENQQFGLDTQAQRLYQATAQGYKIKVPKPKVIGTSRQPTTGTR